MRKNNPNKELTIIEDFEHKHPFFGAKLREHKKKFNEWIAEGTPKKHPSCQSMFWNYRTKIITIFEAERDLDWSGEGAECGMNSFPSHEACKNSKETNRIWMTCKMT